jgi:hypothetical protein
MDLMTLLNEGIASTSNMRTISKKTEANVDQVAAVLFSAVPVLISNMQKNADSKEGADSLRKALGDHAGQDVSDTAGFFENLDLQDGEKILGHILGSATQTDQVEKNLAARTGLKKSQVASILAMAAPLLLSYLGKEKENAEKEEEKDAGGGLASMLESVLGGGSPDSGFDIGSLISFATKDSDNDGKSDLGETLGKLLGGRKLF